jgi:hypothetical protein
MIVNLGISEPVRRNYGTGVTSHRTRTEPMRRVWLAWIPDDEYAHLVALLRGEP